MEALPSHVVGATSGEAARAAEPLRIGDWLALPPTSFHWRGENN
jgi:hypothetical protein